eukprot:1419452-Prymnesium_polylepis.1
MSTSAPVSGRETWGNSSSRSLLRQNPSQGAQPRRAPLLSLLCKGAGVAMSSGGVRLNVFPTRQNLQVRAGAPFMPAGAAALGRRTPAPPLCLGRAATRGRPSSPHARAQVMKVKLVGAKKGHSLLKKKADALTMRLRALLKNILQAKEDMGAAMREGNFALAEVKYAAGDIKPTVLESVGTAQKRVEIRVDNIAGVKVPVFKAVDVAHVGADHTGLSKGGQQIAKVRAALARPYVIPCADVVRVRAGPPRSPAGPERAPTAPRAAPLSQARVTFARAVDVLVQLATLQT